MLYLQWENHNKSLKLEEQTLDKIKARIHKKVMNASGTWIDWQHLFEAASLLARCRYTLQYTYPYAYYMEQGSRKELVSTFKYLIYNITYCPLSYVFNIVIIN